MAVHELHPALYDEVEVPAVSGENEDLREELRELIYGSGRKTELAILLFPECSKNSAVSRLHRTLEDDPETFFDINYIEKTLKFLGPAPTLRFVRFFLAKLDLAPRNGLTRRTEPTTDALVAELVKERKAAREQNARLEAKEQLLLDKLEKQKSGKR